LEFVKLNHESARLKKRIVGKFSQLWIGNDDNDNDDNNNNNNKMNCNHSRAAYYKNQKQCLLKKLNDNFRLVIVVIELSVIAYLIMIACG
jgi:hypothetical protein